MKCNCSSINKHEIVGLCDIQKFNEKIKAFKDKSWSQVVISDNVVLLGDRPNIKTITKTFIDVKITSTKLINTPKSKETNIEGLKLTGKLLLVAGEINQRILYISNYGNSDKIHSFKIKSPFTTYIVVDENGDIAQDKFCIYTCIEYSSIRPINECKLNQNVTLFLFAHKINNANPPGPDPPVPTEPYPNEVIFKNDSNQELARVVFNIQDMTLTATKTGNVQMEVDHIILEFLLLDSDGIILKGYGKIMGNLDATDFVSKLNAKAFEYGNIVKVTYLEKPNRVQITNYPTTGHTYQPMLSDSESFIVTQTGLVPYELPNRIISENSRNQKVVEVVFTRFNNEIKVISTGNKLDNVASEWYLFVGLVSSTGVIKRNGEVRNGQDGTQFKGSLDGKYYSIGDLIYIVTGTGNINHTKITNFPTTGSTYSLNERVERFEITANGLVAKPPNRYPNEIYLRTNTGQEFGKMIFPFSTKKIYFQDIDDTIRETGGSGAIIEVKLYASDGTTFKKSGRIMRGEIITNFLINIEGTDFEYGDIIQIDCKDDRNRIRISNYPYDGNIYTPTDIVERFRINFDRFLKVPISPPTITYPNEVIFKNDGNEELARVVFNTGNRTLTVTDTGNVQAGTAGVHIIEFVVFNNDGTIIRKSGQILANQDATDFVDDLNGKLFNYKDIVNIKYYGNPNRVEITNYPSQGQTYQPILVESEAFIVTQTGLVPYELPNRIIAENSSNQKVVEVVFTKLNNEIKVISTGNKLDTGDSWYLYVGLVSSTGMFKRNVEVRNGQDGTEFKGSLDGADYSIGDFVYIITRTENFAHTKITNYPNKGDTYSLKQIFEVFEITDNGLVAINNNYPNEISLKTSSGQEFAKLIFLSKTKQISFKDINTAVMEDGSTRDMIIEVKLYASNGTTLKKQKEINKGENIESFIVNMKETDFEYGDRIEINSTNDQNRIQISNFPTDAQNYIPTNAVETFRIGADRLIKVNP